MRTERPVAVRLITTRPPFCSNVTGCGGALVCAFACEVADAFLSFVALFECRSSPQKATALDAGSLEDSADSSPGVGSADNGL
mmetsp:Transcript_15622/g.59371  ORF Transcript_15622/g.59371 Transcript_15622/m.59371 type:complete len:83 (-) Transcript_15622:1988-2236(-)